MIKESIQEEDITIISLYAPDIGALQYVRQMLPSMKKEINSNKIIVGHLIHHSHQWIEQLNKISKETQTLNGTMDQFDLIDIYRTFNPQRMNFIFISSAHGTFSRI